jgi:enamine deaminase RidA (YjgF/YER057c/UK114 family)
MAKHFQEPYPARAAIEISALPKGAGVEMDGILEVGSSSSDHFSM